MDDHISREKALYNIIQLFDDCLLDAVLNTIRKIPAAEVVPMAYHEQCVSDEIEKRTYE